MPVRSIGRLAFGAGRHCFAWQSCGASENSVAANKTSETGKPAEESSHYSSGSTDAQIIAFIDAEIRKAWADAGLTPSLHATDSEWCRRVYLDLFGRVPTVAELKQFLGGATDTKKAKLLDKLLDSDDYTAEYARNWTTIWTNLLIGRPPARPNRRDPTNREGMQQYLRQTFLQNKPYDKMVYELVSATGSTKPGSDKYNGERTSSSTSWRKMPPKPPARRPSTSLARRCNAPNATTTRSMTGSRTSSGV